ITQLSDADGAAACRSLTLSLHDALPISAVSGDVLTASGTLSALNIFGLLTGSFDFALSQTTPAAKQTLDALTLSALNLVLGSSKIGRAHVCTLVTGESRTPTTASKNKSY